MTAKHKRQIASTALIIGFFVMWELICLAFGIKDIVLPRPTQIVTTLVVMLWSFWANKLWTFARRSDA